MRRKTLALVLVLGCVLSLAACGSSSSDSSSSQAGQETAADATASSDADATASSDADATASSEDEATDDMSGDITALTMETYESAIGFSIDYDPAFMELSEDENRVTFTYVGGEELDANVYIAFDYYSDMSAEDLAYGLVLQSGQDDVQAETAYFGADSIETQEVYIQEDVNGVSQIISSHVVPMGDSASLLVEAGGYAGMPVQAEYVFEEMLGTFKLNN